MRKRLTLPLAIGGAFLVLAAGGCGGDDEPAAESAAKTPQAEETAPADAKPTVLWPAPPDPLELTVAAGLKPERKEYLINHVHAHLDVFVDGKPVEVPAGIGINIDDPGVRKFDNPVGYGGIEGCDTPCISPLHTHDADGVIHTESKTPKPNTLGEFFTEWDVRLSDSCVGEHCGEVAIYVDGREYTEDPRAIELTDQKEIAIVIGTPPPEIPKTGDFSAA